MDRCSDDTPETLELVDTRLELEQLFDKAESQHEKIARMALIDERVQIFSCSEISVSENVQVGIINEVTQEAGKPYLIEKMDEAYFKNLEGVKSDLNAFAAAFELDTALKLDCGSNINKRVRCSNGEMVRFATYLGRAAVQLRIVRNNREAKLRYSYVLASLLNKVFEKPLIAKMDAGYFKNTSKVRRDLWSFTAALGELDEVKKTGLSPLDLNLNDQNKKLKIICANGEGVRLITYVRRAGIALGIASNNEEAQSKCSIILAALLDSIRVMDATYFKDLNNIRADLSSYAVEFKLASAPSLKWGVNVLNRPAMCSNMERIGFLKYLHVAGAELGILDEISPNYAAVLEYLLNTSYEMESILKMDEVYFNNFDIVKEDLKAFALQLGLSDPCDLKSGNSNLWTAVRCKNGEDVKFATYLNRAAMKLKLKKKNHSFVLAFLLNKCYGKPMLQKMDKLYFEEVENIRADLNSYAALFGLSSPFDIHCSKATLAELMICKNGESKSFKSYLLNAEKELNIISETKSEYTKILQHLLNVAFIRGTATPQSGVVLF